MIPFTGSGTWHVVPDPFWRRSSIVPPTPSRVQEYAFVLTLREQRPVMPPELRNRVLAGQGHGRERRWRTLAWAAGLLLAMGGGYTLGRLTPPQEVVREVVVEKPPSEQQIAVLAVALKAAYKNWVSVEMEGTSCRKIQADRHILDMLHYCPLVQELERVRSQRPDLIVFKGP